MCINKATVKTVNNSIMKQKQDYASSTEMKNL
jgi:hypothetical protein